MPGIDQTSAFSSGTEREAGYAYIQREILALEEATRSWKQRHNELSLIFRLPRELLATVFKEARLASYVGPDLFRLPRELLAIVLKEQLASYVTHVCRHWRQVALGDPYMWNHITFEQPGLAQEMLNRSGTVPLAVEFGFLRKLHTSADAVVEQILMQLQRIKNLKLKLEHHNAQTLLELLVHPAPLLETCSIVLSADAQLPAQFFNMCPRLKVLSISGCTLDWKSSSFGTLRTLDIDCEFSQEQSAYDIISALSSMPFLERLKYHDGGLYDESMSMSTVNLPQLQSLDITSNLATCILFNDSIIHANTSHIQFMYLPDSGQSSYDAADSTLIRVLATSLGIQLPGPISSLNIQDDHLIAIGLSDLHPTSEYVFKFFLLPPNEFSSPMMFENLLQPLPLRCLQNLIIGPINLNISSSNWVTVFGNLKHLTNIDVIGYVLQGFIKALSFGCTSTATAGEKFTALEQLTIRYWELDDSVPRDAAVSENVYTAVQNLKECLKMRKEHGILLGKLFLNSCQHVAKVEVDELEMICVNVYWDGQGNYTEKDKPV